ncbi:unnamed protein product [Coffea canephora]|uniref:DH200=94 genomic scaffold, scaffold_9410 n=1 Tax=Coffea canephora TaxID=49390 RepID=A0A068VMP4_COFCA|nr:unnamed protein product [Coffea canephora]
MSSVLLKCVITIGFLLRISVQVIVLLLTHSLRYSIGNDDDEDAIVIGAATSVLAARYAALEVYKTPVVIPKPPHVNRE